MNLKCDLNRMCLGEPVQFLFDTYQNHISFMRCEKHKIRDMYHHECEVSRDEYMIWKIHES